MHRTRDLGGAEALALARPVDQPDGDRKRDSDTSTDQNTAIGIAGCHSGDETDQYRYYQETAAAELVLLSHGRAMAEEGCQRQPRHMVSGLLTMLIRSRETRFC